MQLFDDDALAFACFERFMREARRNFKHDESGIKCAACPAARPLIAAPRGLVSDPPASSPRAHPIWLCRQQLLQIGRILADTDPALYSKLCLLGAGDCMFAYRMVIVMMRRELPQHEVMTLWEMQWAHDALLALPAPWSLASSSAAEAAAALPRSDSAGPVPEASSSPAVAAGLQSTVRSMGEAAASASGRRQSAAGGSTGHPAAKEPPPSFILQFIAAVVRSQRARVLNDCQDTDDVLRLFNMVRVDFWPSMATAKKQFKAYTQVRAGAGCGLGLGAGSSCLPGTWEGSTNFCLCSQGLAVLQRL